MSTGNPRDPHSLRIVDQETGDELAELGMEVRRRAVVCRECRFCNRDQIFYGDGARSGQLVRADECHAFNDQCKKKNQAADCKFFEPIPAPLARFSSNGVVTLLLATTFGGAVVGLLWLLVGGG